MQQQQATFKPRMRRLGEGRYLVESAAHRGTGHQVDLLTMRCGCKSFQYRGGACKHITLAESFERGYQLMRAQATTARKEEGAVPMTAGAPSGIVRPVRGEGAYMASTGARGMGALLEAFGG